MPYIYPTHTVHTHANHTPLLLHARPCVSTWG